MLLGFISNAKFWYICKYINYKITYLNCMYKLNTNFDKYFSILRNENTMKIRKTNDITLSSHNNTMLF